MKPLEMNWTISILFVAFLMGATKADYVKLSIKNMAGLHCLAESVYHLQDITDDVEYDLKLCGFESSAALTYIRDDIINILHITRKIIALNNSICHDGPKRNIAAMTSKTTTALLCQTKVIDEMAKLKKAIKLATKEIDRVKKTNECVTLNLVNWKLELTSFNTLIKSCVDIAKVA